MASRMWISDFSIRNPVVTTVVMLALSLFGLVALMTLDTDEFPEVNPPVVSISIPYPGAAPGTVEREVVEPLEEAISSISGVDEVAGTALDGFGILIVTFVFEKDLQQATQDIRDKISEIRQDLPPEIEEPLLTRFDPNDLPIVTLALSSESMSLTELSRLADPLITSELRSLNGVAQVDVVGEVERELTVELDPQAMQSAGVGVPQVVAALQTANLAAPVGRLTGELDERTIRLRGRLEEPADFADIAVTTSRGAIVRLGDVATVRDGSEEPRSLAMFDDEQAVGIEIVKATGASTTDVAERVRERVEELRERIPPQAEPRYVSDAGERVEDSVRNVEHALIEGALLTILVVFLFLNSWRSTVITGLALPVSVLASFIAVLAFGFTLNTMSLLGLSLAIGILIDDAIVVRENIVRHMEMGKDHMRAAQEGTAEIGLAVAATTFSIVVVFVPIAFMGGIAEQWFAPFALTIACSVLVSLFVSFSLDPMLSAYWPDPHRDPAKAGWITRKVAAFNHWFDGQTGRYRRVIRWALEHRAATVAIALVSFFGALAMPAVGLIGSEFFPLQDVSEFTISVETPAGSNLDYTRLKAMEAARVARTREEVAYTYATVGGQGGAVDEANVYVRLVPKGERSASQQDVQEDLRRRTGRIAGATTGLATGGFGPTKQIQIEITGPDIEILSDLANRVDSIVQLVPGAVDVGLSTGGEKPELEVALDRDLASDLGLSVAQVAQSLRPAFAGIDVGDWVDPAGETRDVVVRLTPEARVNAADLAALPLILPGRGGGSGGGSGGFGGLNTGFSGGAPAAVPLGQVATIERAMGPAQIDHLDRRRVVTVGANTQNRPLSAVVADIQTGIADLPVPPGYAITQGGETEDTAEVFGRIMAALGIAVLLMYLVLVIQFKSFLDPIPIMASLPLSLIGVMLALLVTGSTLNIMSMIGVILLMGIVAKNAILLVDFAKWSEEAGAERHDAIIEAGATRLRPIVMTSVAIIAGMFPVALGIGEGADFRAPLGRAVIGGVITSTLLTLLVIPTFYDILASTRDRVSARLRSMRPAGVPVVAEPAALE